MIGDRQIADLEAEVAALESSGEALLERDADLEGADAETFDEITASLTRTRQRLAQMRTLVAAAANPASRESGTDPTANGLTLHTPTRLADPWAFSNETMNGVGGVELRTRAVDALERSEKVSDHPFPIDAEARDRIVNAFARNNGDEIAEWAVVATDPAYTTAWQKLQADSEHGHRQFTPAEVAAYQRAKTWTARAAMSETGTHGSELVPAFLDPQIHLTNVGARDDVRSIARVVTIPTQTWTGVASSGITAEWTAEASEVTDASPTFTAPTITPVRADAYVQYSIELGMDTNIGSQLGPLFADAKVRLEATAWATGTGSTQPTGIITTLSGTTASRVSAVTNASFGAPDIFAVAQSLPARYQQSASWLMNPTVSIEARKFALASGNVSSAFWADLGQGTPPTLLGYPVRFSTGMQAAPISAATASNDDLLVLGDFSQLYCIVDRVGMFTQQVPVVLGTNRRPTGETGTVVWWRTSGKVINADAGRLLRV